MTGTTNILLSLGGQGTNGTLLIDAQGVFKYRAQSPTGVVVPNGFQSSAGVVNMMPLGGKALVTYAQPWLFVPGNNLSVRVTGTNPSGGALSEDITVPEGSIYQIGSSVFGTITQCNLLNGPGGSDSPFCVGNRYQVTPSTSGFNDVTFYGAIGLRTISSNNTNCQLGGCLSDFNNPSGAVPIPASSSVNVRRWANTNTRTYSINSGADTILLPANVLFAQGFVPFTGTISQVRCTDVSGFIVFVDIGINYTEAV